MADAVRTTRHSERNDWSTPRWLFDGLAARIPFTVDLAATAADSLTPRYGFDNVMPGDVAWLNPPYGRDLEECLRRAGCLLAPVAPLAGLVALLPVRTSTGWWHDWPMNTARQTVFIRGRLRFGGLNVNAPFDSALVTFSAHPDTLPRIRRLVALQGHQAIHWEDNP